MNKMTTISALFGAALIALPAFAADDELIVFDWSGYEDPNFLKETIPTKIFESKKGRKIELCFSCFEQEKENSDKQKIGLIYDHGETIDKHIYSFRKKIKNEKTFIRSHSNKSRSSNQRYISTNTKIRKRNKRNKFFKNNAIS